MATIEINGQNHEVLTYTSQAYGVATAAANLAVQTSSAFNLQEKYIIKIATGTQVTAINLIVNIVQEDDNFRAVAMTAGGLVASTASTTVLKAVVALGAAALGLTITAPIAIGIGIVGIGVGLYTSSLGSDEGAKLYDLGHDWYNNNFEMQGDNTVVGENNNDVTVSTTDSMKVFLDNNSSLITSFTQNWDIRATIPSVSNPESYAEQLKYDSISKTAIVKTSNETTLNEGTILLLKKDINQITINNHTADVATPTNLQLRNALTSIDDYQFLLSNILIKSGEKLDMGAAGVITVSSGDTLSQLAVQHLGGNAVDATREAVLLNPWLADYGRIKFSDDINKVLIKDGAVLNDNNNDHTLIGENADDLLIDRNGGEDTLIGNAGDDYLDGGSGADTLVGGRGYDTYITNNEDMIFDEDGSGIVKFEGLTLAGGKEIEGQSGVYRGSSGEVYTLTSDGNLEVQKTNGSLTTIYNYNKDNRDLGIYLGVCRIKHHKFTKNTTYCGI